MLDTFYVLGGPTDSDKLGVRFKTDGDIEIYVNDVFIDSVNDDTYDSGASASRAAAPA